MYRASHVRLLCMCAHSGQGVRPGGTGARSDRVRYACALFPVVSIRGGESLLVTVDTLETRRGGPDDYAAAACKDERNGDPVVPLAHGLEDEHGAYAADDLATMRGGGGRLEDVAVRLVVVKLMEHYASQAKVAAWPPGSESRIELLRHADRLGWRWGGW